MSLLHKTKTKRYSVELPVEIIDILKTHLKDTFSNKTKWFVKAINNQVQHDRKNIITNLKDDNMKK
jgi:hypothetical protein